MSEIEWEEVKGATWADIRKGYKYDWVYLNSADEWMIDENVVAELDHHSARPDYGDILLRAWKPVEKPKPTVAFVDNVVSSFAVYKADAYYYEAKTGQFIDHEDEVDAFICEGVVVPAEELRELMETIRAHAISLCREDPVRLAGIRLIDRCRELGVFDD